MSHIKKVAMGFMFEERLAYLLNTIPGTRTIPGFRMYSPVLGKMTEIDVLWLTPKGLFCLECKRYSKHIIGNLDDLLWSCTSGGGWFRKFNFAIQNEHHIRVLRRYLRRNRLPIYNFVSIIVVPDTTFITTDCNNVFNISDFLASYSTLLDLNLDVNEIYNNIINMDCIGR